jgi:glyoxylase-like metal-dependent hydrolase (beta-lactamase superfamily II)
VSLREPARRARILGRVAVEMRDVVDGLWLWRQPHPAWEEGNDWEPEVASFAVESRGASVLLDPLAPPPGAREVWERIDRLRPDTVAILKPDHVRDVDLFVRWYGARAYGPYLFWRDDIPDTELEPIRPGMELPGGLIAHHDGRGAMETPVYLPEQRALVFADALTAPGGALRVWYTPWHEERVLPALRELLDIPFEHVLVSHGDPVHTRQDFEAALEREPWSDWNLA